MAVRWVYDGNDYEASCINCSREPEHMGLWRLMKQLEAMKKKETV